MRDWLRLIRVAGLFSILGNALAAVAAAVYTRVLDLDQLPRELYSTGSTAIWVIAASLLMYVAGMLWNDIADCERDAVLHPHRPLPSGSIRLEHAWLVAILVTTAALLCAAQAGWRGLAMGGLVLSLALLYDLASKDLPWLGSLTMALTRAAHAVFCLLIIGDEYFDRTVQTTAHMLGLMPAPLGGAPPVYATLLGCYVFGLTLISELESRRGRRIELLCGGLAIALALVFALRGIFSAHWLTTLLREGRSMLAVGGLLAALALAAWLVARLIRPWLRAVRLGSCAAVPPAVQAGLGGMLLFDALITVAYHPMLALLILLLIPAQILVLRLTGPRT